MVIHPLAWRRLGAGIIDAVLAGIIYRLLDLMLWTWLAMILAWLLFLLRDALPMSFLKRCSPGKKYLGLRTYGDNGFPSNDVASIKRNLPFLAGDLLYLACVLILGLVPILGQALAWVVGTMAMLVIVGTEAYKVFTDPEGRRLGDLLAGTYVAEQTDRDTA